eukprot:CAMPEP_0206325310 /NCGR_PEP_ID=MMETSP0106_2-20121207/21001_1 /ASSEMBLY_ACC=CAM_ASM_000206 /TAXON_ID=81532 /ORGANISM="Acanthoeca-like sp., Strain 10tr" /LENGTH=72 /DNA_ID=CAMNT_0053757761 /DNA_START=422 /DNA_END=637 /DNA_ORIENTATION=-
MCRMEYPQWELDVTHVPRALGSWQPACGAYVGVADRSQSGVVQAAVCGVHQRVKRCRIGHWPNRELPNLRLG